MSVLAPSPTELFINSLMLPGWEYLQPNPVVSQMRRQVMNNLLLIAYTNGIGGGVTLPKDVGCSYFLPDGVTLNPTGQMTADSGFRLSHTAITPLGVTVSAGSPIPASGVLNGDGLVLRDGWPYTDFGVTDPLNGGDADERWITPAAMTAPNSTTVPVYSTLVNKALDQVHACAFWGVWNEDTNPQITQVEYFKSIGGQPKIAIMIQELNVAQQVDCYHVPVFYANNDTVAIQVVGTANVTNKVGLRSIVVERIGVKINTPLV